MNPVRPRRPLGWAATALLGLGASGIGCDRTGGDAIVIASPWPEARRVEFLRTSPTPEARIEWIALDAEDQVGRALDRRGGVDLILGVSRRKLASLLDRGRLRAISSDPPAPWARVAPGGPAEEAPTSPRFWRVEDPRDDPSMLASMTATIEDKGLARGFDELIGTTQVKASDGKVAAINSDQGLAIAATGRNLSTTLRWVDQLAEAKKIEAEGRDGVDWGRRDDLLADLLGAGLVDSRPELDRARRSIAANNRPEPASTLIGLQPPWPPASVARLSKDGGPASMRDDLLRQLVVDSTARAWLDSSWAKPPGRVDADLLGDLARAEGGSLAIEPRFRAWLRGEWSAWTRQHFRRVARLAEGYRPS